MQSSGWIIAHHLRLKHGRGLRGNAFDKGNNSAQEALAAGVRQLVLPFSTDQFSNGADLERIGAACVLSPNEVTAADLAVAIDVEIASLPRAASPQVRAADLVDALFA